MVGDFMAILILDRPHRINFRQLESAVRQLLPQSMRREEVKYRGKARQGHQGYDLHGLVVGPVELALMLADGQGRARKSSGLFGFLRGRKTEPVADPAKEGGLEAPHVIVMANNRPTTEPVLPWALAVNQAAAALCDLTPTRQVIWRSSQEVVEADAFLRLARLAAEEDNYPHLTWYRMFGVDGVGSPVDSEPAALRTEGLEPFYGRELEYPADRLDDKARIMNLMLCANALIDNGHPFDDGHLYNELIPIRFKTRDRGRFVPGPVYALRLDEEVIQSVRDRAASDASVDNEHATAPPPPIPSVDPGGLVGTLLYERDKTHYGKDTLQSIAVVFGIEDGPIQFENAGSVAELRKIGSSIACTLFGIPHVMSVSYAPLDVETAAILDDGWPGAASDLARHDMQLVISQIDAPVNCEDAHVRAAALSSCLELIGGMTEAIAVHWPTSGVVMKMSRLLELRADGTATIPELWIRHAPLPGNGGVRTTGLVPFIGCELEILPSALPVEKLLVRAESAARQLIGDGLKPAATTLDTKDGQPPLLVAPDMGPDKSGLRLLRLAVEAADLPPTPQPEATPQSRSPIPASKAPDTLAAKEPSAGADIMAILPIKGHVPVDFFLLAERVRDSLPKCLAGTEIRYTGPVDQSGAIEAHGLQFGDLAMKVLVADTPLHRGEIRFTGFGKPLDAETEAALSRHAQHLRVIPERLPKDPLGRLLAAQAATWIAAALCDQAPVICVYWRPAYTAIMPRELNAVIDQAREHAADHRPVLYPLWFALYPGDFVGPEGSTTVPAQSFGLLPFLGRELLVLLLNGLRQEAGQKMIDLLSYMVTLGEMPGPEDDVGVEEGHYHRATLKPQGLMPNIPVLALTPVGSDARGRSYDLILDEAIDWVERRANETPDDLPPPEAFEAVVLLSEPVEISEGALAAGMARLFPDRWPVPKPARPGAEADEKTGFLTVMCGDQLVSAQIQPFPLAAEVHDQAHPDPGSEGGHDLTLAQLRVNAGGMSGPIHHSMHVPARPPEPGHRAHILVSAEPDGADHASRLAAAQAVAHAAAALCEMQQSISVLWRASETLYAAHEFKGNALYFGVKPAALCFLRIIRRTVKDGAGGPDRLGFASAGLIPFLGREVEFTPTNILPAREMLSRMHGLLSYLLSSGPVVRDNETIGVSPREHFRARFQAEGERPGIPVMVLTLESTDSQYDPLRRAANTQPSPSSVLEPASPGGSADDPIGNPASHDAETARVLLLAMIRAARVDGRIIGNERQKIADWYEASALAAENSTFIEEEIGKTRDMDAIVDQIPISLRETAYGLSVSVLGVPGIAERRYLVDLAKRLELDPEIAAGINARYGRRRP